MTDLIAMGAVAGFTGLVFAVLVLIASLLPPRR